MKILIAEEIPSLNKGEAAILYGMIESFKTFKNPEIYLFSLDSFIDAERYSELNVVDIRKELNLKKNFEKNKKSKLIQSLKVFTKYLKFILSFKINSKKKFSKNKIWNYYLDADIIIIGHDGTFSGLFGQVPFLHLFNVLIAKTIKKPIVIYGGSIELENKIQEIIAKFILKRVNLVTLRDKNSYKIYKNKLNVNKNVFLTADLAFLLKPIKKESARKILIDMNVSVEKPIIGITLTKEIFLSCFPEIKSEKERFKESTMLFSKLIDNFINNLGVSVIFLPHCIGPGENLDDRIIAKKVYEKIKNKSKVYKIEKEYSPQELKGLIGECDLFIGERLHSVIGAISMNVPSMTILHSFNRNKILKNILDDKYIIKTDEVEYEHIKSIFYQLWDEKQNINNKLKYQMDITKKSAAKNGVLLENLYNRCLDENTHNLS